MSTNASGKDRAALDGLVYVVSGGAGALGGAVARALADRGARVVCLDRAALAQQRSTSSIESVIVDLADERAVGSAFAALDRLDGSVHCAGGFDMKPIVETTLADLDAMWRMNAASCFLCSREAVRAMRRTREGERRGGGASGATSGGAPPMGRAGAASITSDRPHGWMVNVSARPAVAPVGGMLAYSMSKAAVANLTQSLAAELRGEGILVNAVLPSIMDTPANRAAMPAADHAKWPKVDEVAAVILALASPRNAVTSGALVPVYGAA